MREIIHIFQTNLDFIKTQDLTNVSKEDLAFFYEIKMIVGEKIRPLVNQMRDANLKRQQSLLSNIFSLGKELAESKEESCLAGGFPVKKAASKTDEDLGMAESIFMGRKE
jgi:hypothetical protein